MTRRPASRLPFSSYVPRLCALYEANRDPAAAVPMAAYMRGQFPFLGIKAPLARALQKEALSGLERPTQAELESVGAALWALPAREFQYAGVSVISKHIAVCDRSFLPVAREFIITRSWWETVDALATGVVGPLVLRSPELAPVMDEWLASANIWLARTAILHQLRYREHTDSERLFGYCLARSADTEFFIRKAIGWALREYSKTDASAVRQFVAENEHNLSGLSKREALLWLNGGRRQGDVGETR